MLPFIGCIRSVQMRGGRERDNHRSHPSQCAKVCDDSNNNNRRRNAHYVSVWRACVCVYLFTCYVFESFWRWFLPHCVSSELKTDSMIRLAVVVSFCRTWRFWFWLSSVFMSSARFVSCVRENDFTARMPYYNTLCVQSKEIQIISFCIFRTFVLCIIFIYVFAIFHSVLTSYANLNFNEWNATLALSLCSEFDLELIRWALNACYLLHSM